MDERIILKLTSTIGRPRRGREDNIKIDRLWSGFNWFRKCPVADCCEHGAEPSGTIKGGEFLDW